MQWPTSDIDELIKYGSNVIIKQGFDDISTHDLEVIFLLSNIKFRILWAELPKVLSMEFDADYKRSVDGILNRYHAKKSKSVPKYWQTYIEKLNYIIYLLDFNIGVLEHFLSKNYMSADRVAIRNHFDVLGDIYINIAGLLLEIPENWIPLGATFKTSDSVMFAMMCYEKALESVKKFEIPGEIIDSHRKVRYLDVFYNFFGGRVDVSIVQEKLDFLIAKYPQYFNKKIKSSCWKSGNLCEFRQDQYFDINEGNGVFISMNYSIKENFEIFKSIERILSIYNLKAILKQERLKSLSWSKEICCTIFNNKYAIVLLDKYSPNVVLELGVIYGMGRKAIILINSNQKRGTPEDLLFSMIKDYDCIFYSSFNGLFDKLIKAINGIFFNIIEFKAEEIDSVFTKKEIEVYNKVIQLDQENS